MNQVRLNRRFILTGLIPVALLSLTPASRGSDWLEFRGKDHQANANGAALPKSLSQEENVAWRVELPARGPAGPIIVGDRVIVTSSGGEGRQQDRMHINCYSTKTGEELWHHQFWATGRPFSHPTSANAAPTPASDGERIYAFFSSNDLVCLDLDGQLLWFCGLTYDYPKAANDVGMSSSPTLAGDVVVVQIENQGDSFVAGLDKLTGETLWRQPRTQSAAWASPIAYQVDGVDYVLVLGRDGATGYRARDGEVAFKLAGSGSTVSSAVNLGNKLLLPFDGLTLIDPTQMTDGQPTVLWNSNRLRPSNTSPVVDGTTGYLLSSNGVLTSCDLTDGSRGFQARVDGNYWSTPVVANGYLYAFSQQGTAKIVKLGEEPEVVSEIELGETILASPAVNEDGLFIRTDNALWKLTAE
jgi:outer membrane protein assembly factor BamB